jgi:ubiquinone/menaquinone biosynthesis C-methylase UbiE
MNPDTLKSMLLAEDAHPWYRARLSLVANWSNSFHSDEVVGGIFADVGCGSGAAGITLKKLSGAQVIGIDISEIAREAANSRGLKTLSGTATELPFKKDELDGILALEVVEHVANDKEAMREFHRVIKQNGRLFITVPAHHFLWSNHDVLNHHFRRYSKQSLIELVKSEGFEVLECRYWNSLLFPLFLFIRKFPKKSKITSSEFDLPPKFLAKFLENLLIMETKYTYIGKLLGVSLVLSGRKL